MSSSHGLPLVSVITPAYNAAPYIADAIESILRQTYTHFEHIVIDDCSTDATWSIVQDRARRDSRIRAERNSRNLGIAGTRNRGVALAAGKYVMWQDADDLSMPDRMEEQVAMLESDPEVGIVGGSLRFFDDAGERRERRYLTDDAAMRRVIFRHSPVAQPAAMLRKSVLEQCGEYRYPPTEDLDMLFRIGRISRFANLDKVVLKYRESPGSATATRLRLMEKNTLLIRARNWRLGGYPVSARDVLYNFAHAGTLYLVPARVKLWLFRKLRDHEL